MDRNTNAIVMSKLHDGLEKHVTGLHMVQEVHITTRYMCIRVSFEETSRLVVD